MQIFYRLENENELAFPVAVRIDEFRAFLRDFVRRKLGVNAVDVVDDFFRRLVLLGEAILIHVAQQIAFPALLAKRDRRLKREEFPELAHVDPVAVRIADLRRGGADDDFFRIRTGKDFENRFSQRGAAHDGVVDDDDVFAFLHDAVGNVVDVRGEFRSVFFLRNERAQLDVLVRELFSARPVAHDEPIDQRFVHRSRFQRVFQFFADFAAAVHAKLAHHAVIGRFRRVRNERKDGAQQISVDRFENLRDERRAERLAFPVNGGIVSARKINAFEGAVCFFLRLEDFFEADFSLRVRDHRLAGPEFPHVVLVHVENRHQRDAFRSDGDDFFVADVEAGSDAVRVAEHEHVAASRHAAQREAAVPVRRSVAQHLREVDFARDFLRHFAAGNAGVAQTAENGRMRVVEPITEFFDERLRVGGNDGMRAAVDQRFVELARIRHRKVSGDHQIARRPNRFARERLTSAQIVISRRAVAQMPHQQFAAEIEIRLHRRRHFRDDDAFFDLRVVVGELPRKHFRERGGTQRAIPRHEALSRGNAELHAADSGAVLPAVVLLFHQQKKLIEAVERRAVFVLVKFERLQKPDDGNSAFVLDRIAHRSDIKKNKIRRPRRIEICGNAPRETSKKCNFSPLDSPRENFRNNGRFDENAFRKKSFRGRRNRPRFRRNGGGRIRRARRLRAGA